MFIFPFNSSSTCSASSSSTSSNPGSSSSGSSILNSIVNTRSKTSRSRSSSTSSSNWNCHLHPGRRRKKKKRRKDGDGTENEYEYDTDTDIINIAKDKSKSKSKDRDREPEEPKTSNNYVHYYKLGRKIRKNNMDYSHLSSSSSWLLITSTWFLLFTCLTSSSPSSMAMAKLLASVGTMNETSLSMSMSNGNSNLGSSLAVAAASAAHGYGTASVQSENFISCHFNPLCFCKYDQKTEIYDSVRRLWQIVGFNQTNFFNAVHSLLTHMKNEPSQTYQITEVELNNFAWLIVNASLSPIPQSPVFLVEPGPVFDIECADVPIALIPTEYNAHGVISHVSVTGSKLSMLDGSAFAGLEIQGIQLSRDQLYFISEYAFSSMSNSLSMLDLSGNFLDEAPFAAFKTLKLLEWLNLSNNLLNSIAGDWFSVPTSMRKLLLSANSIDSLPYKLLASFPRLHWLDLSSNFIRNLSKDNLPPNLQTLNLMKNRLSKFPMAVFHLNSLSWLFIGGNSIEDIPSSWAAGVPPRQMNQLDLSENFIQVWPKRAFGSQLTVLDMSVSKNYLQTLPDAAFYSMNIFRLSLGYNRIYMIDPNAFTSLQNTLKYLNLENNRLKTIPWNSLTNLTSLMHLYIGSNSINDEGAEAPEEWSDCKLTYLGLNGNQLTQIPRQLLVRCPHLFHLNLGYNQIANLDDLLHLTTSASNTIGIGSSSRGMRIRRLRNLSTLILRNNPIRTLSYTYNNDLNNLLMTDNHVRRSSDNPNSNNNNDNNNNVNNEIRELSSDSSNNLPLPLPITMESTSNANTNTNTNNNLDPTSTSNEVLQSPNPNPNSNPSKGPNPLGHLSSTNANTNVNMKIDQSGTGNGNSHGRKQENKRKQHNSSVDLSIESSETPGNARGRSNPKFSHSNTNTNTNTNTNPNDPILPTSNPMGSPSDGGGSFTNIFRSDVFPNLHELSLSFCQLIGELEPFPTLPLVTLEISNGLKSATTLHRSIFSSLRNLEWLALDYNSLTSISEYTFYSNRRLSYVNLEWNRLLALPQQMFHPDIHQSMTQLRLSHNRIQTLPSESFFSFPAINLDLSYNLIQVIEKHAFTIAPPANTGGNRNSSNKNNRNMKNDISSTEPISPFNPSSTNSNSGYSSSASTSSSSSSAAGPGTLAGNVANMIARGDDHPGLNVYLNHNRMTTIRPGAFAQERFNLIDLSYNSLTSLSLDIFGRRTIVDGLNVSHNSLERLSLKPRWLGNHIIKFLDLSYNRIPYKGIDFTALCVTRLLDLSHNRLDRTDPRIFPANCSLKELNLGVNSLEMLDPGSFSALRDLTILDLSDNQIVLVPPILFIRNTKLRYLDLSKNRIRSLPRDSLVGSAIEILNLGSNQFVNLPVGALSQISRRLRRLDMSQNSLEHLDSTMFESIAGLVHLNLSHNRLTILPDNAFANLASLRELDLSFNFLRANFKEMFHFLPKLKLLRLCGCGIKVLPFLPLPHLVSLDLAYNGLADIKMQSLGSLTRLRHLDLSWNDLTSSRIPSWTPLYNLVTLKLNSNPLKTLTKDTFYGLNRLENLEILNISKLDRFDTDVLSQLNNLRSLAVETHPIIEKYRFRLGQILSSIPHLEELKVIIKEPVLSDQLQGIQPKLRKLTISGEKLRRIESSALDGLENCFHIDLSITHTSIDDVPAKIFEKLQSAAWARLDLSHNKLSSLDSFTFYPGSNRSVWFSRGTKILEGGLSLAGNEWVCDCTMVSLGDWLRRWLRESFQSHSTDNIPLVHSMYESLRAPKCTDAKGKTIPIIELYSDTMCHASALSSGHSSLLLPSTSTWKTRTTSTSKFQLHFLQVLIIFSTLYSLSTQFLHPFHLLDSFLLFLS